MSSPPDPVFRVARKLNNRPQKCFDFKTRPEVYHSPNKPQHTRCASHLNSSDIKAAGRKIVLINEEQYVRVEKLNGQVFYGVLDVPENTTEAGTILIECRDCFPQSHDKIYFYNVDPLTSEVQRGLDGFNVTDVKTLLVVPGLPIQEDYEIDSLETFYNKRLVNSYVWTESNSATVPLLEDKEFGRQFLRRFHTFFCKNQQLLLDRPMSANSPLRKLDFTELGLDVMRQHYRFVKAEAIRKKRLPSIEALECLLQFTVSHRTMDVDWTKPEIGPWTAKDFAL